MTVEFESTVGTWVSFKLDGQTGIIFDVVGFTSETLIPNWYTETPFTKWRFGFDPVNTVHLIGNTVQITPPNQNGLQKYVDLFCANTICALWLGKFGYIVLDK